MSLGTYAGEEERKQGEAFKARIAGTVRRGHEFLPILRQLVAQVLADEQGLIGKVKTTSARDIESDLQHLVRMMDWLENYEGLLAQDVSKLSPAMGSAVFRTARRVTVSTDKLRKVYDDIQHAASSEQAEKLLEHSGVLREISEELADVERSFGAYVSFLR